jgi:MFS family permease
VAAGAHFVHDGFADIIYVLLPIWATEFRLSFAQVGAIRTAYSGGMALFQIPAGFLAERWGERTILVLGTVVTAAGFVVAGLAGGFISLLLILFLAGLGSGVQHPLASSLVSKAYERGARRTALGTYNFSGDLGKIAAAASVALAAAAIGWRASAAVAGGLGLMAAAITATLLGRFGVGGADAPAGITARAQTGWGIRDSRGFRALAAIGMIDNATRSPFLTLLPFILMAKGVGTTGVGGALALTFVGGALGKFVCGILAERVGVIRTVVLTEVATTLGILTVVAGSREVALGVLLPLGIALNGTSSVLYGTVADLVTSERRSRAYGLYYTLGIGTSALAPSLYGLVSDAVGVPVTLVVIGTLVLATIPLCLALRPAVTAPARA